MNSNGIRAICLRIVFFSAVVLLLCLLSVLPAPARETQRETDAEDVLTNEERLWLMNQPVIRLAPERSYAPFIFQDENGKLQGISVDYTALLEKKLGIKFQTMESNNLAAILDEVQRGEIDMATSLMKTPQRSEFLFFTTPYITVPVAIIVRRGFEGGSTIDSMGAFKIAVGKGYAVQSFLQEKHRSLSLVPVEDDVACLTKVSFGVIDAAVVDLASASYIIDRLKITNLHVAGAVDFSYQLSFASRKDWPELNRILEKGIARISSDEHNEIYNKWVRLSQHTFLTARVIGTALGVILAIILIGVTGATLWNRALKIKIYQKTEELREELAERRRTEATLQKSEEHFREIFERSPVGKSLMSPDGKILRINKAFAEMLGYGIDEFLQVDLAQITHPDDMTKSLECISSLLAGEQSFFRFEKRYIHKNGNTIWVDLSAVLLCNEQGMPLYLISTILDITERKQADKEKMELQSQLLQSQKTESIGSLAGGIAHDLNNILFPISGLSEMLLDEIPPGTREYESIEQIYKSAQRGSDLVKQILAFSRQSNPQKLPIRIQPILKEALKLAQATMPKNIEVKSCINTDCGMVSADPTQIHQIVMNLITNAFHAVEQTGGTIDIALKETAIGSFDEKDESPYHAIPGDLLAGRYACITVSDTGMGIDKTLIDKIFEPYFTTKELGKGTGLGLSVVHGIVKEHGGDIRVYSEAGKGTVFHVYLPLLGDVKDIKTAAITRKYPKGHERILLVDDEAPIVLLEQMMLEKLGYQVTVRTSSPDALYAFKANPGNFDLVLSDRGMPNMTGEQLARKLIAIKPGIPIIICSGFSDEKDVQRAKAMGVKGFLMKPVAMGDLAELVRKVLDEVADSFLKNRSGKAGVTTKDKEPREF